VPVEFAVEYEHRSSEGFDRLDVINAFTSAIKTPPHKASQQPHSRCNAHPRLAAPRQPSRALGVCGAPSCCGASHS
jgi:hypothetical protein